MKQAGLAPLEERPGLPAAHRSWLWRWDHGRVASAVNRGSPVPPLHQCRSGRSEGVGAHHFAPGPRDQSLQGHRIDRLLQMYEPTRPRRLH